MAVDPEGSLSVDLTEVIKIELTNQRLEPLVTEECGKGLILKSMQV